MGFQCESWGKHGGLQDSSPYEGCRNWANFEEVARAGGKGCAVQASLANSTKIDEALCEKVGLLLHDVLLFLNLLELLQQRLLGA